MKVEFNHKGHSIIIDRSTFSMSFKVDGQTQETKESKFFSNHLQDSYFNGEILSGPDKGDEIRVKILAGFFSDDVILYYNDEKIGTKQLFAF